MRLLSKFIDIFYRIIYRYIQALTNIFKYSRFGAQRYLPTNLINKKLQHHLLDINSTDDLCVIYCIAAGLHSGQMRDPTDSSDPVYTEFMKSLNLQDLEFPLAPTDISRFIEQNTHLNITLHTFHYYQNDVYHMQRLV